MDTALYCELSFPRRPVTHKIIAGIQYRGLEISTNAGRRTFTHD
jgi:hypothetical protein